MTPSRGISFVLSPDNGGAESRYAAESQLDIGNFDSLSPDINIRVEPNSTEDETQSGGSQAQGLDDWPPVDTPGHERGQAINQCRVTAIELSRGRGPVDQQDENPQPVTMDLDNLFMDVPQYFFTRHMSVGTRFAYHRYIRPSIAPSRHRPAEYWDFEYFTRCFYEDRLVGAPGTSVSAVCLDTGREIQCYDWTREEGEGDSRVTLLIISRKCSFWSRKTRKDGRPDVVILCDPLPTSISIDGRTMDLIPEKIFGGCADPFLESIGLGAPVDCDDARGVEEEYHLPVESLFDTLSRQFLGGNVGMPSLQALRGNSTFPHPVAFLPLKLIASEYEHLLAFITFQTVSMRSRGWALRRRDEQERAESAQVERDWAQFRCSEFLEALLTGMEIVGMSGYCNLFHPQLQQQQRRDSEHRHGRSRGQSPSPGNLLATPGRSRTLLPENAYPAIWPESDNPWSDLQEDLQWLYQGLRQRRLDYDRLTQSIAALANIQEASRTYLVTKRTERITLLAVVLTPLALLAGYFSMAEMYLPGGGMAWVYPAIATPIIMLILLIYVAIRRRGRWMSRQGGRVGWDALDMAEDRDPV